jgi:uncharacterized protein (DUF1778 family)
LYNNRMTAKPKPPKQASKSAVLYVRLTENDRNLVAQAAKNQGLNMSSWLRQVVYRAIGLIR